MAGTWQITGEQEYGPWGKEPIRRTYAEWCFATEMQRFGARFLAQT
jgi:hypothetical protein